jgi:hypothetical protein
MDFPIYRNLVDAKPASGVIVIQVKVAAIMRPDRVEPGFVADKVGVEAGNGKVIGTLFQH